MYSMYDERVIMGWNPDGSGKVYRLCNDCGEYRPVEEFKPLGCLCKECRRARMRAGYHKWATKRAAKISGMPVPEEPDEDPDVCGLCKSYSPLARYHHGPKNGWCMRHKRVVSYGHTCGNHKSPPRGKFNKAIPTRT
jgi:hypothetical protein